MRLLKDSTNLFGKLSPEVEGRVQAFMDNPSFETWDDIHGIIISATRMRTVWQAVIAVDPSYNNIALSYSSSGKYPPASKRWSRFPDAMTVARAIKLATGGGS